MRRKMVAVAVGLVVVGFAGHDAAVAQQALPVPAGLVIANDVPQVPDSFAHTASLSWQPVNGAGEAFEYVVEVSVPPRAGGDAPYTVLARLGGSATPRQIISTTPWMGPYCFRVRVAVEKKLGEPSAPVCVAKSSDSAPFDVTHLRVELAGTYRAALLYWDFGSFPAPLTLQRSHAGSLDAPREWATIATDAPARAAEDPLAVDYVDFPLSEPGWYCYRARVTNEAADVIWSDEACLVRPVVDGPGVPDVGNSPTKAIHDLPYRWETTVSGIVLLLFGIVNWWVFRGYR